MAAQSTRVASGVRAPEGRAADFLVAIVQGAEAREVEEGVIGVLATALAHHPDASFACRLGGPWGRERFVVCAPGLELAGDVVLAPGGRVFPERTRERSRGLEGGAELFVGADDDEEDLDALLSEIGAYLVAVLGAARARAMADVHESELATLRAQLLHSDRLASLGQLSASVVHELNNPLTAVLAYSDHVARKAERGEIDATDTERLRRVNEAAKRLQDFVRQLAGWSRPGGSDLGTVKLDEAMERALSFCEHSLEREGVVLIRSFGDVQPVFGSLRELVQVFVNLVTNAAQSMHDRGGTVELRTSSEPGWVVAEVLDEGPGIHPSHLPHLFDAFFTTKGPEVGTGLGLNIVRRIVEAHGGEVRAASRPEGGAVFTLRFPTDPPAPAILSTRPPPASEERGIKKKR